MTTIQIKIEDIKPNMLINWFNNNGQQNQSGFYFIMELRERNGRNQWGFTGQWNSCESDDDEDDRSSFYEYTRTHTVLSVDDFLNSYL